MKTIKEAAKEYSEKVSKGRHYKDLIAGFEAGVEFAQRWIHVEEEMPDGNYKGYVNFKIENHISCKKVDSQIEFLNLVGAYGFTHWRPIGYK